MNKKILYIIIGVLVLILIGGGIFLLTNKGSDRGNAVPSQTQTQSGNQSAPTSGEETMVDCTDKDPGCFMSRMATCSPVKAEMKSNDGTTVIEITILGIENEKCHFQRKVNGAANIECYFPKGTLNSDTLDATFGNDHGAEVKKVVDEACHPAGW